MPKVVLINTHGEDNDSAKASHLPFRPRVGPHYPIGVISIAAYLKNKLPTVPVYVFDEQIQSSTDIKRKMMDLKPDVVGINCVFRNYKNILELARVAKKSGAMVVVGGDYVTALAKEVLICRGPNSEDYCIDAVVKEDGEEAFYRYVAGHKLEKINNLVYFYKGQVIENDIKSINLDKFVPIDTYFLNPERYFKEYRKRFPSSIYKRPFLICSQKGCGWRAQTDGGCLFCSLMYKKLRVKNPKKVWEEIDELISNYAIDYIWEVSDSFLSNKEWFTEFYKESLKRSKKPFFKIQARADELIDERVVENLAGMNINQVFIGFESNDNRCLAKLKKGTMDEVNRRAISLLMKYRIPIRAYFLLGAPDETKKSLQKSKHLAEYVLSLNRKNLVVTPYLIPLPGSLAFNLLIEKTGEKYIGKDVIDWNKAIDDWTKYFCKVSVEEMGEIRADLRTTPYDISAYSF